MSGMKKKMVQTAMGCTAAVACFADLMLRMLQDTDVSVRELDVDLTPIGTTVRYATGKGNDSHKNHTIVEVHSHSGKRNWFVDLSGPQFGIFMPCMKHEEKETDESGEFGRIREIEAREEQTDSDGEDETDDETYQQSDEENEEGDDEENEEKDGEEDSDTDEQVDDEEDELFDGKTNEQWDQELEESLKQLNVE
ncbi:hypothetical protein CC86DRAFT_401099 [Ophiobolus disseminans]|uniref:Uncharacterized protein n=1 Tax=Ophiobolus disseminans TaxID=1469910 RepID=A0A6A7AG96_9PLEO|nr:hypothetical protein CC86DRAFT_401099 [Ophiobolus disseminans]